MSPPSRLGPLGTIHTDTTAGTHAPRRPALPRPSPPRRVPRAGSSSRAAPPRQDPPAHHQPLPHRSRAAPGHGQGSQQPRGEQRASATTTPRARPSGCLAPPHRAARAAAGLARASWLSRSLRAHQPEGSASSAVERGTHLPAECFRSPPSSPELLTPAFGVKKEA